MNTLLDYLITKNLKYIAERLLFGKPVQVYEDSEFGFNPADKCSRQEIFFSSCYLKWGLFF
jgi:hypothetical protein